MVSSMVRLMSVLSFRAMIGYCRSPVNELGGGLWAGLCFGFLRRPICGGPAN